MRDYILLMVLAAGLAHALSFEVYSESAVYGPGDIARVYAHIVNAGNESFYGTIYSTLTSDGRSGEAVIPHEAYVEPGSEAAVVLYEFEVTDEYAPGEYAVVAYVISNQVAVGYGEDVFYIEGTPEDMEVWLRACVDEACTNESNAFLVGEAAFISFYSDQEGVGCTATLVKPSGGTVALELPARITIEETGTHRINAECTKEAFNARTPSLMVGGLEEWPQVRTVQGCNENGVCDEGESHTSCPQDCLPQAAGPEAEVEAGWDPAVLVLGALLIAVIVLLAWKMMGKQGIRV